MKRSLTIVSLALLAGSLSLTAAACGDADPTDDGLDEAAELSAGEPLGKEDGVGAPGLKVSLDTSATQVWTVRNNWEDTDTPNAKRAGLAWGEDSGLNWDQKFSRWIDSLKKIPSLSWGDTFELSTPFGKSLPAPKLDCADVAIMLRASFAAWYNLPFVVAAQDGRTTVYFGHFGILTADGERWNNMPRFGQSYRDYTEGAYPSAWEGAWPRDEKLRARGVQKNDEQAFLGGARTGAYLDEIHLNKRAGQFIRLLMIFTGSPHLADGRNTYNLVPEALRAGDTLLYRRARQGSGHTMVIMRAEEIGGGQMQAENAYGNIPPAQPAWESAAATKRRFTSDEAGGPSSNSIGEVYAEIGGGLKRWRVAKNIGGRWTNTWMKADESSWINDRDYDRIAARVEQFEALLGEVTPERKRDLLLEVIGQKRAHLEKYPASCSAREGREEAFDDLYELMSDEFGMDRATVDERYRKLADYVFAELDYLKSKTCCWNSTTPQMYEIIMDYNRELQRDACAEPVVFKAVAGDYATFKTHAAAMGLEGAWVEWSEDEACAQRDVLHDTEAAHDWTPWCSLSLTDEPEGCVEDAPDDNDALAQAEPIDPGSFEAATCHGDDDYYALAGQDGTLQVTLSFTHKDGDIDLELLDPSGRVLAESTSSSDEEMVEVKSEAGRTYVIHVYGYRGAENTYTLEAAYR